jgi:hypothetical protein
VTHLTFAGQRSVKNCTKFNENPSQGLVACTRLHTDGHFLHITRSLFVLRKERVVCSNVRNRGVKCVKEGSNCIILCVTHCECECCEQRLMIWVSTNTIF